MNEERVREDFEKFIGSDPFSMDVSRFPDDPKKFAWPGSYRDSRVDMAWECWLKARMVYYEEAMKLRDHITKCGLCYSFTRGHIKSHPGGTGAFKCPPIEDLEEERERLGGTTSERKATQHALP